MTDKEIKELIDAELIRNPEDEKLYQKLYRDLAQEDPDMALNSDFRLNVLSKVQAKKRQLVRERLLIAVGTSIFIIAALITLIITKSLSVFSSLNGLLGYVIIFSVLYFVFHRLERRMIKST